MDYVYMTQCSLIRTYHQMDCARNTIVCSDTPRVVDWLRKVTANLFCRDRGNIYGE